MNLEFHDTGKEGSVSYKASHLSRDRNCQILPFNFQWPCCNFIKMC